MNNSSDTHPMAHVVEQGSRGPTLVFLHYYGGSSRTWAPVLAVLPPDLRAIAPDLRGWGAAARPADGYALGDYADDVEALVAAKGLTDFVLVGHSMGGKIAQLVASRRPPGLRGVVLVAPAPPTPMALPIEALQAMAHVYDTRESIEQALAMALTSRPLSPALHEQVVADSLAGAPAAKRAWPLGISQEDIGTAVADIQVPVLVISGSADKVDSTETLRRELLPRIATARLHVLDGIGHLVPLEAAQAVAALVTKFVHDHATTAANA
ncbi:alpha/beta hydrolase [Bacillus sp. NP157]|nr:alpha/beta hydrolase [Bacillus sp. NP157]